MRALTLLALLVSATASAQEPATPRVPSCSSGDEPSSESARRARPASFSLRTASRVSSGVALGVRQGFNPLLTAYLICANRSGRFSGSPPVSTKMGTPISETWSMRW